MAGFPVARRNRPRNLITTWLPVRTRRRLLPGQLRSSFLASIVFQRYQI